MEKLSIQDFDLAYKNVKEYLPDPTPITKSLVLSDICGRNVFLKWETKLPTGAFKERGALNFLTRDINDKGSANINDLTYCAASAGNHALGLAYHSKRVGVKCHLVMPKSAPITKIKLAEKLGATVVLKGANFDEAKDFATLYAEENKYTFVPAFDHPYIIAGQGTIGYEILNQVPEVDCVISPIGGGGLISGISSALRLKGSKAHITGVQSNWSLRYRSKDLNEIKKFARGTLGDGIAVKVPGIITQNIIDQNVNQLVSVSESDIAATMVFLLENEKAVVEGSGAVGISPILKDQLPKNCKNIVVVLSGANVDLSILSKLIDREMASRSQMVKMLLTVPDRPGVLHSISGAFAEHQANVLEVSYDRSFSYSPGDVDVTFVIEVRDSDHRDVVLKELENLGLGITLLSPSTS